MIAFPKSLDIVHASIMEEYEETLKEMSYEELCQEYCEKIGDELGELESLDQDDIFDYLLDTKASFLYRELLNERT